MLDFAQLFFCVYYNDDIFFPFLFINMVSHANWLPHPLHKLHLVLMRLSFFNILLIGFTKISFGIYAFTILMDIGLAQ